MSVEERRGEWGRQGVKRCSSAKRKGEGEKDKRQKTKDKRNKIKDKRKKTKVSQASHRIPHTIFSFNIEIKCYFSPGFHSFIKLS